MAMKKKTKSAKAKKATKAKKSLRKKIAARSARRPATKKKAPARKASAKKRPARSRSRQVGAGGLVEIEPMPVPQGPPPMPADAIEVSGIYGKVLYSESDPYAEVREIFNQYDRDRSGSIEAREFARICEALGMELDDEELEAGIASLDSDGDGRISWDEFIGWWKSTGR